MRFSSIAVLGLAFVSLGAVAQQPSSAHAPFVVEETYWIKPGKEQQFIGLFEKTQAPLLRARMKEGRILWVRLTRPNFNATNEQWDLRVTEAWRDADSAMGQVPQARGPLTMEQQMMEELITEHTDVPIQQWSVDDVGT
jgi:hypothetical protein